MYVFIVSGYYSPFFVQILAHTATWATGSKLHNIWAYSNYGLKNAYDIGLHAHRLSSPFTIIVTNMLEYSLPQWSCRGNYGRCIASYKRPCANQPRIRDYFVTSLLHPRNLLSIARYYSILIPFIYFEKSFHTATMTVHSAARVENGSFEEKTKRIPHGHEIYPDGSDFSITR